MKDSRRRFDKNFKFWIVVLTCWCFNIGTHYAGGIKVALPTEVSIDPEGSIPSVTIKSKGEKTETSVTSDARTVQCVSSAFEMPGQAWHVNISSGGITMHAQSLGSAIAIPNDRAKDLKTYIDDTGKARISLIVIDNFQKSELELQEIGEGNPSTWSIRHGALVEAHLKSVLQGSGFSGISPNYNTFVRGARVVDIINFDYGKVKNNLGGSYLLAGPDTKVLTAKIMEYLKGKEIGDYVVINMSFALIPCDIQQRYFELEAAANEIHLRYPFNQFLAEVEKLSRAAGFWQNSDNRETVFTQINPDDPFLKWLKKMKTQYPTIAVASSGNYGLNFETMPAAWSGVLGISSISAQTKIKSDWSDVGDISEIGEWFSFRKGVSSGVCLAGSDDFCVSPYALDAQRFAYRGTSFSAPTASAAFAANLGKKGCKITKGWMNIPKLFKSSTTLKHYLDTYCHS